MPFLHVDNLFTFCQTSNLKYVLNHAHSWGYTVLWWKAVDIWWFKYRSNNSTTSWHSWLFNIYTWYSFIEHKGTDRKAVSANMNLLTLATIILTYTGESTFLSYGVDDCPILLYVIYRKRHTFCCRLLIYRSWNIFNHFYKFLIMCQNIIYIQL